MREERSRAGDGVRNRNKHLAALARMARRLCQRLHGQAHAALSQLRIEVKLHRACAGGASFEEYVSTPPSPCLSADAPATRRLRQQRALGQLARGRPARSLGPPDVISFVSDTLTAPVKISGQPIANLLASTSGTDSDWVVKLIDLYPDEVGAQQEMGGYQLMVAADIFRGRYRESFETPKAIARTSRCSIASRFPLRITFSCRPPHHGANPVRMVSTLRPQSANFRAQHFLAKPGDYRKATQRIYHTPARQHSSNCHSSLRPECGAGWCPVPALLPRAGFDARIEMTETKAWKKQNRNGGSRKISRLPRRWTKCGRP